MRILFVHERFGACGGAESNILATAIELGARGNAVGILHGPSTGKGEAAWRDAFPFRRPFQKGQSFSETRELFQPDVIYVHKLSETKLLEQLLDSEIPVVRMVHDHDLYCMRSYKYNYFTRHICERPLSSFCIIPCGSSIGRDRDGGFPLKWVSYTAKTRELELNRRFHRLIVASQYMKGELLRNRFNSSQIELHPPVPPTVDTSCQSSFSNRNLIIYSGQIVRGKGVDVLLESLARVKVPFSCLIFGDGAHREACEKHSRKLGLADRVIFKGFVAPEEITAFYREASVAVVSSVWPEPFGAVGLEAMRFGLPVVAFDAGGIREWLANGQNGFLVPWMDRGLFAVRVEELLRDKVLAREMGDRGRKLMTGQFAFSKYVTGLENLFSRVASQPSLAIST